MNAEYLKELTELLRQARPGLARAHLLEFKSVFGAVAGYADGRIFVSYGNFGFALKLAPERCATLLREKNVQPLRYFPNGHVKKSYVVLPGRIIEDFIQLGDLLDESLDFVLHATPLKPLHFTP